MKSENHQDPIQNLAKKLREHTLPYKEGAWEQFELKIQKRKKTLILWPYFSAAAVLLIAISLFFVPEEKQVPLPVAERTIDMNNVPINPEKVEELEKKADNIQSLADKNKNHYVNKESKINEERALVAFQSKKSTSTLSVEENSQQQQQEQDALSVASIMEPAVSVGQEVGNATIDEAEIAPLGAALAGTGNKKQVPSIIEKKETVDAFAEFLRTDVNENYISQELDKKWSFGVGVSPNVSSNNQVNIGGGVAVSYAVSRKVSISSGVSYLQVGAERDPFANKGQAPSDFPTDGFSALALAGKEKIKTLDRSKTSLGGLDIPLNVNYQLSKRVYASAGVSVFNVLTERNLNSYHNQEAAIVYGGDKLKRPEPVVRSFYSDEISSEKNYEGNLNGFINFSVGYEIPLSEKVGVSLEPFVKIPMGSVNENQFNLNNGGLRISTRF